MRCIYWYIILGLSLPSNSPVESWTFIPHAHLGNPCATPLSSSHQHLSSFLCEPYAVDTTQSLREVFVVFINEPVTKRMQHVHVMCFQPFSLTYPKVKRKRKEKKKKATACVFTVASRSRAFLSFLSHAHFSRRNTKLCTCTHFFLSFFYFLDRLVSVTPTLSWHPHRY